MSNQSFKEYFNELPFYLLSSLVIFDLGIILGALNAFRLSEFLFKDIFEIHILHYNSTLLGGVSLIMIGLMMFFFSFLNEGNHRLHKLTPLLLLYWLSGILVYYGSAFFIDNRLELQDLSSAMLLIGSILFFIYLNSFYFFRIFRSKVSSNLTVIYFSVGLFWQVFALGFLGYVDCNLSSPCVTGTPFIVFYMNGFFATILFGSLFFVLPRLYNQPTETTAINKLHLLLYILGVTMLIVHKYILFFQNTDYWVLSYAGSFLLILAFVFFLLWFADFLYKVGLDPSLLTLLFGMLFYAFYLVDLLMSFVFTVWVPANHIHFLFLGLLVITIGSIGSKIILTLMSGDSLQVGDSSKFDWNLDSLLKSESKIHFLTLGSIVLSVGGILLAFTVQLVITAAFFGLLLFFSIITLQVNLIKTIRQKS